MDWYLSQCDNDWEHTYGVEIGTLDNPGWAVKVELKETPLEDRSFARVPNGEPTDHLVEWRRTGSWWVAGASEGVFQASCGPPNLPEVISLFRKWVQSSHQDSVRFPPLPSATDPLL